MARVKSLAVRTGFTSSSLRLIIGRHIPGLLVLTVEREADLCWESIVLVTDPVNSVIVCGLGKLNGTRRRAEAAISSLGQLPVDDQRPAI
jgi:hypothetical protein